MHTALSTASLPPLLAEAAETAWQRILEQPGQTAVGELQAALAHCEASSAQLPRVLACSPFIVDVLRRNPEPLVELLGSGRLQRRARPGELRELLEQALAAADSDLSRELRRFRQREMLRIVWRDFTRSADTLVTM